MVIEYIRYRIPDERRADFERAYAEAQSSLAESDHCYGWELSHGIEEPDNYILRITWDSVEGHEQGFRKSPEFGPFLQAIRPFIGDIAEMRHYEVTEVKGGP